MCVPVCSVFPPSHLRIAFYSCRSFCFCNLCSSTGRCHVPIWLSLFVPYSISPVSPLRICQSMKSLSIVVEVMRHVTWELLAVACPAKNPDLEWGRQAKGRRNRRYSSFLLFMVVMFYKWPQTELVNIQLLLLGEIQAPVPVSPWSHLHQLVNSVLFNHSVMSSSLRPHELRHARLCCPSPSPGLWSNSCPLSQ